MPHVERQMRALSDVVSLTSEDTHGMLAGISSQMFLIFMELMQWPRPYIVRCHFRNYQPAILFTLSQFYYSCAFVAVVPVTGEGSAVQEDV